MNLKSSSRCGDNTHECKYWKPRWHWKIWL